MKNNPLVTVLIPVYNAEKYISEAIESITNQTYSNLEILIIDDGSKDKSLKIINAYAENDNRIRVVSRENKGLVDTLNEGIKLATGKYIARMDADDISMLKRLEYQVKYLESHKEVTVCGTWIEKFGENFKKKWRTPVTDKEIKKYLFFGSPFAHPSVMFRTENLIRNNIFYEKYQSTEDFALWIKMAAQNFKFYNIPKVLLEYRVIETSITQQAEKNKIERKKALKKIYGLYYKEIQGINADSSLLECHFLLVAGKLNKKELDRFLKLNKNNMNNITREILLFKYNKFHIKNLFSFFMNKTLKITKGFFYDILNSFYPC